MTKLRKLLKHNGVLDYITSFGCPESRIDPYPQRCQLEGGKDAIRIRFAVGFRDDYERVMNGLHRIAVALQQVATK